MKFTAYLYIFSKCFYQLFNWLLTIKLRDISVIYVMAYRCVKLFIRILPTRVLSGTRACHTLSQTQHQRLYQLEIHSDSIEHEFMARQPISEYIERVSPIHSTSLEMSEVSSETDMLLISVPQQTDAAICRKVL